MPAGKNQHYVPQFYFRQFSKDGVTIRMFNLSRELQLDAPIQGQCSESYFYGQNAKIEATFSDLECLAREIIQKVIDGKRLTVLTDQEVINLYSHVLFQHGRTKSRANINQEMADHAYEMFKELMASDPGLKAEGITKADIDNTQLVLKTPVNQTLIYSMTSVPLICDLASVLIVNKSDTEFVFSDNPVVLFNSILNGKVRENPAGLVSGGLQIFYPLSPRLLLLIYDPRHYRIDQNADYVATVHKNKDAMRINGLLVLTAHQNVYYANDKMDKKLLVRYRELRHARPAASTEKELYDVRYVDGERHEIYRFSSAQIKYNMELSFVHPFDEQHVLRIRNPVLVEAHNEAIHKLECGEIKSVEEFVRTYESYCARRADDRNQD